MSVGPPPYQEKGYPAEPSAPYMPPSATQSNYYPPQNPDGHPPYGTAYPSANPTGTGPGYATAYSPNQPGAYDNPSFGAYPGQPGVGQPNDANVEHGRTVEENQWNVTSFSDKRIRQAFIKKVYLILMTQLTFTFAIVCIFSFYQPIKDWMRSGTNQAVYWVSYAVFLVTYIVLVCVPSVRRRVPGNYICLTIFTLALTYMTATLSSFHSTYIVVVAIGITAAVCLAISLFAIQTKIDFTMCAGLLFALSMVVFFFGISILICYLVTRDHFALYVMNCVYGGLAALLFGLFLAYDTQMLIGGRKYQLSEEEYVYGALQLYLDVVYLFIIILGLFGLSNK